jgi:hypothetical protein
MQISTHFPMGRTARKSLKKKLSKNQILLKKIIFTILARKAEKRQ